ncbi:MAG: response regulator [Gemmatimonadaceae bacterium]|nr:response regulator [Gemmatimonadaceae bacterium]
MPSWRWGRRAATGRWALSLGGILTSATRAANLVRQVLVFSRRQVVSARVIEVAPAIQESARLLERLLGERITLRVDVAEDVGPVLIDPGQLEQVLMNLAANARDAMPQGGTVSIAVDRAPDAERVRLGLPTATYVRFSISDTGPGVPPEARPRLFEPFFTTKTRDHGTGLGLSISYGILQSAGGAIELDPTVARGATFRFYLPEQLPSAVPASSVESPEMPRGGTERLLLVEDDPSVAEVARRLLTRAGYTVRVLRDAESALMALEGESFDLLLSDVVMPGMSGAALAQEARRRHPALRVLLMSGYPDDDLVAHEIARQEVSFLAKPFSQASLLSTVRTLLDDP